jgi:glycosyltransferase involved in cell wall biosynthesis
VDDLYSLADALVFPSIDEGFGLPVIEAAVHRLPIVCTDLPTLRALVGPGATYVDPGASGGAFADAVEAALDRAGAPLAGRVRRRLDWGRIVSDEVIPAIFD